MRSAIVEGAAPTPEEVTDEALVGRLRCGETAAFTALYRRHAARVARLLRALVGSSGEIDDMLQTTFLEAHRCLGRYAADRPFRAWLNGIAINVSHRQRRSRARRFWQLLLPTHDMPEPQAPTLRNPEQRAMANELSDSLYRAMAQLPSGMRTVFALHDLHDMGLTEVAQTIDSTPLAVWMQLQRARAHLRKHLARRWQNTLPYEGSR